jgi:hypothetical protein
LGPHKLWPRFVVLKQTVQPGRKADLQGRDFQSLCENPNIFVRRGFSHDIKSAISISALAPDATLIAARPRFDIWVHFVLSLRSFRIERTTELAENSESAEKNAPKHAM